MIASRTTAMISRYLPGTKASRIARINASRLSISEMLISLSLTPVVFPLVYVLLDCN